MFYIKNSESGRKCPTPTALHPQPVADWRRLNQLHFPPDVHASMLECIGQEAIRLLDRDGPGAFEMPRSAAVAHETGHAIVGTREGFGIKAIRVFRHKFSRNKWYGLTSDNNGIWIIDPATSTPTVLARVRYLIAGEVGEALLDRECYRSGSSLDEIVISQMICASLLQERGSEFAAYDHPSKLWNLCRAQAGYIIHSNEDIARQIMRKLAYKDRLRGKQLTAIVDQVKHV